MAIEFIDTIKPKNNGTFPIVEAVDIDMGDGTRLSDKTFGAKVESALPSNNVALSNVMYFLGELSSLTVGFPEDAKNGDMIYIAFNSGEIPTTLVTTTKNHVGLNDIIIKSNCYYEIIGMRNGSKWIFAKNEVANE